MASSSIVSESLFPFGAPFCDTLIANCGGKYYKLHSFPPDTDRAREEALPKYS